MSKDELHSIANQTTPAEFSVPKSWGGLIAWALAKFGAGAIFLIMLVPVYLDLKESNARFSNISSSNVRVLEALAAKIEASNATMQRLDEALRRIEIQKD